MHIYLHLVKFVKYIFVLNIIFTCLLYTLTSPQKPTLGRLPHINIYIYIIYIYTSASCHPVATSVGFTKLLSLHRRIQDALPPFLGMWMPQDENVGTVDPFRNPFIVFKGAKKVRSKGCLVNVSLNTFGILAYNLAGIIWPNNITTCILKTLYHHGCS